MCECGTGCYFNIRRYFRSIKISLFRFNLNRLVYVSCYYAHLFIRSMFNRFYPLIILVYINLKNGPIIRLNITIFDYIEKLIAQTRWHML